MTEQSAFEFEIRVLTAADVGVMNQMLSLFSAAFDDPRQYDGARPRTTYLQRLLASENFIAIAAVRDDAVVGGLAAYVLDKFEQERREIYIYDLAVDATARRQGIATTSIRTLQSIATDRGADVIFVQADRDDAPAIALYESLGVREDVLHFDIAVIPRSD